MLTLTGSDYMEMEIEKCFIIYKIGGTFKIGIRISIRFGMQFADIYRRVCSTPPRCMPGCEASDERRVIAMYIQEDGVHNE